MLCINCDKKLENMDIYETYICDCGAYYSKVLIDEIEESFKQRYEWDYIRTNKFFKMIDRKVTVYKIGDEFVHPEVYELHHKKMKLMGEVKNGKAVTI